VPRKSYRSFYIQVSRIKPETNSYDLRVGTGIPGGQPGFDEKETHSFNENVFLVESGGRRINLLDRLRTRDITAPQLCQLGAILSDLMLPGKVRDRLLRTAAPPQLKVPNKQHVKHSQVYPAKLCVDSSRLSVLTSASRESKNVIDISSSLLSRLLATSRRLT